MTIAANPAEPIAQTDDRPSGPPAHRHCRNRSVSGFRIALIVLGFIVFWPIGLALLAWTLWRRQITESSAWQSLRNLRWSSRRDDSPAASRFHGLMSRRPDNVALAEYLEREQERLRAEQSRLDDLVKAFEAFKDAERRSADERDFEAFLQQRRSDETNR